MKLKEIVDGWLNVAFTDDEVEKIADKRNEICNNCPLKGSMMKVDVCLVCHCPLVAKVRSMESACPKEFWTAEMKIKNKNL